MADIEKLRADYERAERALYALDGEHEEKRAALKEKYRSRLDELGQDAAAAQKALCDAEAAHALAGRDGMDDKAKAALAESLGLTLP